MLNKFNYKKKRIEFIPLVLAIIITASLTTYSNYEKNNNKKIYDGFIDNVYLKKTLNHIINNLEPKYKRIKHQIKSGETFDEILKDYEIDKVEYI